MMLKVTDDDRVLVIKKQYIVAVEKRNNGKAVVHTTIGVFHSNMDYETLVEELEDYVL